MSKSLLILLLSLWVSQAWSVEEQAMGVQRDLDFKVFVNDREVGRHQFVLLEQGNSVQVSSKMSLDFKVLMIKRVKYLHEASEVWVLGCLASVQSATEKQGKLFSVDAKADHSGLVIQRQQEVDVIPGCVRGFAYWNADWLQGDHLLNAESGIYVPVEISSRLSEQDNITHMTIATPKADIHLQYSAAGDWLSLQTELLIGGTLRYQRVF